MALILTARLDSYTPDGDLLTTDNTDIIFTMLSAWDWARNYNLMRLDIPHGTSRHVTILDLGQVSKSLGALQNFAGHLEGWARLDLMSRDSLQQVVFVNGVTYDPYLYLINLPPRAATAALPARPMISLVRLKVPLASGQYLENWVSFEQLSIAMIGLQTVE
jgi:hypothetical protein